MSKKSKKSSKKKAAKRKMRKTERLIFGVGLTSIIFIVATYAWFIGLTQVSVSDFEIEVKSSDGLTISLDANTFSSEVAVSKDDVTTGLTEYTTNTNTWVSEEGLSPLSSFGMLDTTTSRLKLYSKNSLVSINGGYKLRTSLVDNSTDETGEYVAFDLFIKNTSGSGYDSTFNYLNDEGVYLTKDSKVGLTSTGEGGDGIENSIRVGFMQIGRIKYNITDSKTKAQGITCTGDDDVTSLCNKGDSTNTTGRGITWNIWEPNDKKHTQESLDHFTKICKKRTDTTTYSGTCDAFGLTDYVKTYAIKDVISATDNVNIYDGLNDYENLTKIEEFPYFTDTDRDLTEGKEIFYLAPNSITKIRVYIWMEGQDVDNFDLGSIGKKITVTFGFTKDRYSEAPVVPEPESEPEPEPEP